MRFRAALLLVLTAGTTAGCARAVQIPSRPIPQLLADDSPFRLPGLSTGDAWLRYHLIEGNPAAALEVFESPADRPTTDPLLLSLHEAVIQRQVGDYERSNELLEWADEEAERRHVRSVSRTAASFLVSDRVLSYTPTATERSMVPYYRIMNYLDLGDPDGAAVEARRMSAILSETRRSDLRRCRGDAMLNQLAGLVFERAGEWNDAIVSLRRAEDDYAACAAAGLIAADAGLETDLIRVASAAGLHELADSLRILHPDAVRPLGADSVEVIVFVERGFIAHRAEESLHVPIFDDDLDGLESSDNDRIGEIAADAIARLAYNAGERARWGRSWDDDPSVQASRALAGAHILRLAWPSIHLPEETFALPAVRLMVGGSEASGANVGNLSALVVAELEAERPAMLARLVTRSLTKFLISREVEKKAEKQGGELVGFLAGRLMNIAANETERADTRSWTLLPAEIQIVRRRVPAGEVAVGRVGQPMVDGGRAEMQMAGDGVHSATLADPAASVIPATPVGLATSMDLPTSVEPTTPVFPAKAGTQLFANEQGPPTAEAIAGMVEATKPASVMNGRLSLRAGERRIVSMSIFGNPSGADDGFPFSVDYQSEAEDELLAPARASPSVQPLATTRDDAAADPSHEIVNHLPGNESPNAVSESDPD